MPAKRPFIEIGSRKVGKGFPVYIVAELSANHRQHFDEAVRLVEAAKEAGADAVKLQTYTADTITIKSDAPEFRMSGGTLWDGKTLYDLYEEAHTPWEWHPKLKERAAKLGLDLFSTPFDKTAVDFLENMGVPAYKVASFELVDIPLIRYIAGNGKPMIMSTGMATKAEIEEAVQAARESGASQIALLQCTSAYPCPPEEMDLRGITRLVRAFRVPVGLSDHSPGFASAVGAVALGACMIEKHLTLSRAVASPDSAFSMEPAEFKSMVEAVRTVEKALDRSGQGEGVQESKSRAFRRSLFVVKDMKAGDTFTLDNVRSIRPACGLPPRHLDEVLGKKAARDIKRGTPLDFGLVA